MSRGDVITDAFSGGLRTIGVMALRFPSEIIVEQFIPTARAKLAEEMKARGFTQQEIADVLGVTQAAVSRYVRGDVPIAEELSSHRKFQRTITRIADGYEKSTIDDYEVLGEFIELIQDFEDRGPICEIHEAEMPALQGLGCDLCVRGPDTAIQLERETLGDVRNAARLITTNPRVSKLIPNVGANIGAAIEGATTESDIAAIPGRLYTIGDRVEVPANPEFGASQHVATMLLSAHQLDQSIRGAINIRTVDSFLATAREAGFETVAFDASYDNRAGRLCEIFSEDGVPDIVYHEGAFGIEPITYVLGASAVAVAETIISLIGDEESE